MNASLHAHDVSLSLGPRPILDAVGLDVHPRQRIALVGPNGVGKSTLLRVLAGQIRPTRGTVRTTPPDATVLLVAQEPERSGESVRARIARLAGVTDADAELHAATEALAADAPGAADRYDRALQHWLAVGAADLEARLGQVSQQLGIAERLLDTSSEHLSGGEAARVQLATMLLAQDGVLLLDEPTNDLDRAGLETLERFVTSRDGGTVIVSHDRHFLAVVATAVAELDEFTHRLTRYDGGWESYRRERELAAEHARRAYEEYADKRDVLAARAQREREWASQGQSKARKDTSEGDKFIRAFKINQTEQLAGRAARTERAIERLTVVDEPRTAWELRLQLAEAPRSGDLLAELEGAVVERPNFRLGPVTLRVGFGERVVIEGSNGAGKTTLLRALLGEQPLNAGRARQGPSVRFGRMEQLRTQFGDEIAVLDAFMRRTGWTVSEARTLLAKFGIGAEHVGRAVGSLSPGERTRLVLALFQAEQSNCLVLDEPTNHLDLPAIEQLEQALATYRGTILLISHDRAFLERVRRTRTISLSAGQVSADRGE